MSQSNENRNYNHNNFNGYNRNGSYQNSENNPYYNQPTHNPYSKILFAISSLVCGGFSLMLSCSGILAIPLGALSILFAVLAYRKGKKFHSAAITGVVLSCVGIAFGIFMIIYSQIIFPKMMENPIIRQQMNTVSEQLYGISFDEMMDGYYNE